MYFWVKVMYGSGRRQLRWTGSKNKKTVHYGFRVIHKKSRKRRHPFRLRLWQFLRSLVCRTACGGNRRSYFFSGAPTATEQSWPGWPWGGFIPGATGPEDCAGITAGNLTFWFCCGPIEAEFRGAPTAMAQL
jgi:hypothetical protein